MTIFILGSALSCRLLGTKVRLLKCKTFRSLAGIVFLTGNQKLIILSDKKLSDDLSLI